MLYPILFFGELFLLFLLSRALTQRLSLFFFSRTRSQTVTIYLMAILFFPGTVIHELSHALAASFLGVHVAQLEFIPKFRGDSIKLGSVAVAKTDPFRRLLIGMAPFLLGTLLLLALLWASLSYHLYQDRLVLLFVGYSIFEIGNTMFSSAKDMEGALDVLLFLTVLVLLCFFLGFRLPAISPGVLFSKPMVVQIAKSGCLYLLVPIGIDILFIFFLRLFRVRKGS